MLKNNKKQLALTSFVILLPAIVGLLLWNRLPALLPTHYALTCEADPFGAKAIAVFVIPLLTLFTHWLCVLLTATDRKNAGRNDKMFRVMLWICPLVSIFDSALLFAIPTGNTASAFHLRLLLLGLLFAVIGNYLPKCTQNTTLGIKLPWTLGSEENWNATHRFAGKVWVCCGLVIALCAALPAKFVFLMVGAIFAAAIVPSVYSYQFYQKQKAAGTFEGALPARSRMSRPAMLAALAITLAALTFAGVLLFTGNIRVEYGEDTFTLNASYWPDLTVRYEAVEKLSLRETDDVGTRTNGRGSFRLLAGAFLNREFENYTRYSYTACPYNVVLRIGGRYLVINGPDEAATREIYAQLLARCVNAQAG